MTIKRFGVSLEAELLDNYVMENQFANPSQAIRQKLNKNMVNNMWKCNNLVARSITMVYNY